MCLNSLLYLPVQGGGEAYPTHSERSKGNWIGHIWRMYCLLKRVIAGNRGNYRSDGKTRKKR